MAGIQYNNAAVNKPSRAESLGYSDFVRACFPVKMHRYQDLNPRPDTLEFGNCKNFLNEHVPRNVFEDNTIHEPVTQHWATTVQPTGCYISTHV